MIEFLPVNAMSTDPNNDVSSQGAAYKRWSVILGVTILLVAALGRLSTASVLWAAAPLLLLGLADAAYAAKQRRNAELSKASKGEEQRSLRSSETVDAILQTVVAVFSPSIWPFYVGLAAIVVAGAFNLPAREASSKVTSAPMIGTAGTLPNLPYSQTTNSAVPPSMIPQRMPYGSTFPIQPPPNPGMQRPITPPGQRAVTPVNYRPPSTGRPLITSPKFPRATPALSPAGPPTPQD